MVNHHGTAWCFMPSRTKPGVSGGASPLHHLVVEAPHRLDLSEWERVCGVAVLEVEVVRAPGFGVGVFIALCRERKQRNPPGDT